MFSALLQLIHRWSPRDYERAFVREVRVRHREPRSRRSERLLAAGWLLIAIKTWAMFWLASRYALPFDPWWIVGPTLFAAAACTWIYLRRD